MLEKGEKKESNRSAKRAKRSRLMLPGKRSWLERFTQQFRILWLWRKSHSRKKEKHYAQEGGGKQVGKGNAVLLARVRSNMEG